MPLNLIHGPPNSGRAGLIRRRFAAALDRAPVLVVPTLDDVFDFERELCEGGRRAGRLRDDLRGAVQAVATAGGSPPSAELTPAQRLRASRSRSRSGEAGSGRCGAPPRRPGFALAFERLLDELQAAGVEPGAVEAAAGDAGGLRLPGRPCQPLRGATSRFATDSAWSTRTAIAREAIALLRRPGDFWGGRPLFLYGLDDLTRNQLELIEALVRARPRSRWRSPYEEGRAALAARAAPARAAARGDRRGRGDRGRPRRRQHAEPAPLPPRAQLRRRRPRPAPRPATGLVLLRSAGARGEAEAIAAEVGEADRRGLRPGRDRDRPARPGAARPADRRGARVLRRPRRARGRGAGRRHRGRRRPARPARGGVRHRPGKRPAALPARTVGRPPRQGRLAGARGAPAPCPDRRGGAGAVAGRGRRAAARPGAACSEAAAALPAELAAEVGAPRGDMASRRLRGGEDGPRPAPGDGIELRAAAAIADGARRAGRARRARARAEELAATIAGARIPRLERAGRGTSADRQPLPPAGGALRPRLRRLAAGRRVPPPRPRRRPLPLRTPARVARARPAPRRRRRGALPLLCLPLPAAKSGSSSPTATATRTAPRGALAAARRRPPPARPAPARRGRRTRSRSR